MSKEICFHCGLDIPKEDEVLFDEKSFCCAGCKTVYEIFTLNDLSNYYVFEKNPGATPQKIDGKYNFLDNDSIIHRLLEFNEENVAIISLNIPHIHCSSCIWILENLHKLNNNILTSQVNFSEKKARITFNPTKITLKEIVLLISSIGYEPYISLENYDAGNTNIDRSLTYKLGLAFFSFGNIMLLSFPEYFEVQEYWLDNYRPFFRWLIFALAVPSFLYSASGYYISAYKSIRSKMLNIDVPIALGIIVMFVRSSIDIFFDYGSGFFDSLTGLIFFMLLGKMFQIKTYSFLSFERDFKSYFPIAVTRINKDFTEESVPVYDIKKTDRLLIRNQELIPTDGILMSESAEIDYSFVTGEAVPINKKSGDKIYAGGKQIGKVIEIEVINTVSHSYLTQLWSNEVFQKKFEQTHKTITDKVSQYFSPSLMFIAFAGFFYWVFEDVNAAFNVFTAVLIVACPCALALTAPFTMGNVLRIMGKRKFYLKNALVIEQLAKVDTIVFDKTGTITTNKRSNIEYEGNTIAEEQLTLLKKVFRASNHPLSRMLSDYLYNKEKENSIPEQIKKTQIESFEEISGKGILAKIAGDNFRVGSAEFVLNDLEYIDFKNRNKTNLQTTVFVSINNMFYGNFVFNSQYRHGISELFQELSRKYKITVLSGDNEGERETLENILPKGTTMAFNQKPKEKLEYIKKLQQQGMNVMMVGDGLNDSGALAQSDVGISISENVNVFSPACDAILDAGEFYKLSYFLKLSKNSIKTMKMSFAFSILYNIVGLSFAVSKNLSPLVAAIIMPLSTITIVSFVTLMSNYYSRINDVRRE